MRLDFEIPLACGMKVEVLSFFLQSFYGCLEHVPFYLTSFVDAWDILPV